MINSKNFKEIIKVAGSTAYLLTGGEKTALFDCGMAYTAKKLIKGIEEVLGEKPLDCVFLTHSHYDHMGALPYLKMRWPGLTVYASEYAAYVFTRPGAQRVIKEYSFKAAEENFIEIEDYDNALLSVDTTLADGQKVDLGGHTVTAVELLGHTKCSMGYFIDENTLFASESTGLYDTSGIVHPTFVLSYKDALASIEKCQTLAPQNIVTPHGSLLPLAEVPNYWQLCKDAVDGICSFVQTCADKGMGEEKIVDAVVENYWVKDIKEIQPLFAFIANAKVLVGSILNGQ